MFDHICMIGLGYIGLPTATLFASRRVRVTGVDVVPHVVETINSGRIHIVEPELDELVHAAVNSGGSACTGLGCRLTLTGSPLPERAGTASPRHSARTVSRWSHTTCLWRP